MRKLFLLITALAVLALNVNGQSLDAMIDRDIASWLTTYRNLHTTPELSHREEKTSAFVASELRKLGFTVTEHIGKYQNEQWLGYGIVIVAFGHALAALYHHYVLHDWVLGRMFPPARRSESRA